MTTAYKRRFRTRTSRRFCQEKFCCPTEKAIADFYCVECKSDQCQSCEANIHKSKVQFSFHDRKPIEPPPYEDLCQVASLLTNLDCVDGNFSDLRCEDCERCFCFQCFELFHNKENKKNHRKVSVKEYKQRQLTTFQDSSQSLSSLSSDNDSLKFVTLQPIPESSDSMMSYSSFHSDNSQNSIPDLCIPAEKNDLSSLTKELEESFIDNRYGDCTSFLLVDEQENLQCFTAFQCLYAPVCGHSVEPPYWDNSKADPCFIEAVLVEDEKDFVRKLNCDRDELVKVVSIFGNTGDGKSHTLNHTFFGGKEVFKTSPHQASCTVGVWASYDILNKSVVIDTEGLLGITSNQNQRTRLLLKLLAISDVVVYRTRAERLHNDMFYFLSDASKAYSKHFTEELRAVSKRNKMSLDITNLSPAVVIFHETHNTNPLGMPAGAQSAELIIRERFKELDCCMGFSDLKYVGTRTSRDHATDFTRLLKVVQDQLNNNSIRAPRKPAIVFKTLQVLNDKFSGEIEKPMLDTFPDQYFTCNARCQSCGARCTRSMNHNIEEEDHQCEKSQKCKYQHQYENKVYYCKKCYLNGKQERVVPKTSGSKDNAWVGVVKYVWAGDILECKNCGIIYRSRQYWYGNPEVQKVVHEEVVHVWPEGNTFLIGTHNAARKVIDGLTYVKESISNVSAKPTKVVTDWVADQIAPDYWIPNSQIKVCYKCDVKLEEEQKHHCRACGRGFCDDCTAYQRAVPERGWPSPVRVCEKCYSVNMTDSSSSTGSESKVTARKVGESVGTAFDVLSTAINYPIGMLKDSARPAYWVPDEEIKSCNVCEREFSLKLPIHHCRACGQGVCDTCSPNKRSVPLRGWDYPVRVCKKCEKKKDKL